MKFIIPALVASWVFIPLQSIAHEVIRKVGENPHPVVHSLNHHDKTTLAIAVGVGMFLIVLVLAIRYDGPGELGGPGGF